MDYELLYWHWLILGMVLIMIEIVLPSFTALWFGTGAVLVGILLLFFPELALGWQIFIWAVVSAILTYCWFRYLRPLSIDKTKAGLSKEAIVGQSGHVVELPHDEKRGKLRFATPILGNEEWYIICEQDLTLGDRVWVNDVSGNTLIVERRD